MFKVLVADKNCETNSNCCQFLANDKSLDVIGASSGISVINKYHEIHPNILVINSDFEDIHNTEIINAISSTSQERNNSNIILTAEDGNILFDADYAVKVYKFFRYPLDYKKIKKGIDQYILDKYIFYEPSDEKLTALFYKIDLYNDFLGADYFKYAIQRCYENQKLMSTLDCIFIDVAKHFKASIKSIRPAMRKALISVNRTRQNCGNVGYYKLFKNEDFITPKNFIRIITTHYLKQKN